MKANIANLRSRLSHWLEFVAKGNELEIQKRNITVAKLIPVRQEQKNSTVLGAGKNSAKFFGSLTDPFLSEKDWEMHR